MTSQPNLQHLPQAWMQSGPAAKVLAALTAEGDEARFVGGCVRDALMGRPIKDVDIATPLPPDRVIALLERAGLKAVPTGLDHGTVTAVADHQGIEVTTLRVDVDTDGRRATVAFTDDWQADAARRDLTINALSCGADGKVHDYFGGLEDLAAGRVRFVGDARQRITEDYLRLLRFFRFHADFALRDFDQPAIAAARELAPHLKTLSGERLRQETLKLLVARRGPEVWGDMLNLGIVEWYLPWATSLDRLRAVAEREHRLDIAADPIRRLGALVLTGCGEEVATTLRLSRAESERVIGLTAARESFDVATPEIVRRQIYALGNEAALDRLLLDWPEMRDGAPSRAALLIVRNWPRPTLPVQGSDVVRLGVRPGPRVGEILRDLESWWIEGDFQADRAKCIARLTQLCDPAH